MRPGAGYRGGSISGAAIPGVVQEFTSSKTIASGITWRPTPGVGRRHASAARRLTLVVAVKVRGVFVSDPEARSGRVKVLTHHQSPSFHVAGLLSAHAIVIF